MVTQGLGSLDGVLDWGGGKGLPLTRELGSWEMNELHC